VKVEWIGGPESPPPKDQFDSVRSGIIDVAFSTNSYYGNIVPASDSFALSPFTPSEERENGYFNYLGNLFKENEVTYLGCMIGEQPFYLWSNEKVESIIDLEWG
jgi:TRAP-type transport system periplasmic protein